MGQQQINQYAIERTTFGDDDYYDIDYWNGSVYKTAKIKGSVIKAGASGIGLFSQTSQSTPITNTTTETTLIGSGVGALSVPADTFAVGSSYTLKLGGFISSLNNSDIVIRIKSGSVILADTGTIEIPTMSNKCFEIEIDFTIRTLGVSGVASIITMGELNYIQNSGSSFEGNNFCVGNTTTFDTTILNTLDVTWQWATASASNIVTTDIFNLRRTY